MFNIKKFMPTLFLEKKLELPYIGESILSNESLENESCDVQTTLVET